MQIENIIKKLLDMGIPSWKIYQYWENYIYEFEDLGLSEKEIELLRKSTPNQDLIISLSKKNLPKLNSKIKLAIELGLKDYRAWGLINDWESGICDYSYDKIFYDGKNEILKQTDYIEEDILLSAYKYSVDFEKTLDNKRR